MDHTTFRPTLLLVGMGGALWTLRILAILMGRLTRLCHVRPEGGKHD